MHNTPHQPSRTLEASPNVDFFTFKLSWWRKHKIVEDYDVDVRNINNGVVDKCCKQSKAIGRFEIC
jgi:hypothetical protein